jgi:hypothetical protein
MSGTALLHVAGNVWQRGSPSRFNVCSEAATVTLKGAVALLAINGPAASDCNRPDRSQSASGTACSIPDIGTSDLIVSNVATNSMSATPTTDQCGHLMFEPNLTQR